MHNPFKKDHTTTWIATIAIGAIAAAAIAYFYFRSNDDSEEQEEYLQPPYHKQPAKKKRKTDPHDMEPIVPGKGE